MNDEEKKVFNILEKSYLGLRDNYNRLSTTYTQKVYDYDLLYKKNKELEEQLLLCHKDLPSQDQLDEKDILIKILMDRVNELEKKFVHNKKK